MDHNNMNTTTGDIFIPEVWSQELIVAVESNLVLASRVWRFDGDVAEYGNVIHVPQISNLEANDKLNNVDVQLQAPTETDVQITVNTHKESSFVIEDKLSKQAKYNLMAQYNKRSAYAIVKAVDSSLAGLASGFSQTFGTYNTAITTDVVLDSIEALDNADVPQEDRYFCFRPDVKRDLLDLATYTSRDFVGEDKPVRTGTVGDLYGVETAMSTNLVKAGSNTNNMLFHREALALAWQMKPRMQMEYMLQRLGTLCVADTIYGFAETRDTFGVLVKT